MNAQDIQPQLSNNQEIISGLNLNPSAFEKRLAIAKERIQDEHKRQELVSNKINFSKDRWSGIPCLSGTRFRVLDIISVVCQGTEEEQALLKDYEYIKDEDINACLFFADRFQRECTFLNLGMNIQKLINLIARFTTLVTHPIPM